MIYATAAVLALIGASWFAALRGAARDYARAVDAGYHEPGEETETR